MSCRKSDAEYLKTRPIDNSQFKEYRRRSMSDIAELFNVPSSMVQEPALTMGDIERAEKKFLAEIVTFDIKCKRKEGTRNESNRSA